MPTGAGELWAKVGETAMKASEMLQHSALNPAVRAQMKYAIDNFKRGQEIIDYHRQLGEKGFLLGRATTQGAEELSPAESGAAFAPLFQPKIPPPPGKEPPPAPEHAPGTGNEPQEKTGQEKTQQSTGPKEKNAPPTDSAKPEPKVDPEHPENFNDVALNTQVPSRGGSTAALTAGPGGQPNTGQPQSSDVEAQPAAAYRAQYAAQHPQGAPAGMFLNPATGSYEPLQQQAPTQAAQPQQQGGSIWSRPTPIAPPPAPQAQAQAQTNQPGNMLLQGSQPQSQTAGAIQQVTQAPGVALADWQAQNAHPVMSSNDALNWAKNYDTGAQRATYLPHGGPNAEPAYAFHMKGGGVNTVPISQIVKNGGGPLVAGQNTSATLSASDALSNPPPGQQPPGQAPPAQQPAIPAQGGQVWNPQQPAPIQPGPPPAAPGQQPGQLSDAELQARLAAATNVQSAGGPSLAALTAEAGQQAGTRPTDTPIRPEATPLSDQEKADFTPEAIAAAKANAKVQPNQPHNGTDLDGSGGDPSMGDLGPWHLYRDDQNRTGELYAIRPGLTSLFKQQRYYLGSDGWREYELPNTNMRLAMEAEYGGVQKGGVGGVIAPSGNKFPIWDHEAISQMSVRAMQGWLAKAARYHNTTGDVNSNMENRFTGLMDMSRRTQRLIDGENIADQEGTSRDDYTREAQYRSHEAAERDRLRPPSGAPRRWSPPEIEADIANRAARDYHDGQARHTPVNKFSDYLEEQVKRLNDDEGQLPGRQLAIQKPGSGEGPSISGSGYGLSGTLKLGSGVGESKSQHRAIERLFEGAPASHAEVVAGLQDHKNEIDRQFEQAYNDAIAHNYRLTPEIVAYHNALHNHGLTLDSKDPHNEGNPFRDQNGRLINPYRATASSTPPSTGDARQQLRQVGGLPRGGATAQPTPTPAAEFDNVEDAKNFVKSHKSGTRFKVKGKEFTVD